MIFCDLTHAYHERSGGIRTFLDLKRRYILEYTDHQHVLIIPGAEPSVETGDRWKTYRVSSRALPFGSTYRFFPRSRALLRALNDASPDIVELNTYYMPPEWKAVFTYRDAEASRGRHIVTGAHYHTDFADSYIQAYGAKWTGPLIHPIVRYARHYVSSVLSKADEVMTLAPQFVDQLNRFGVEHVSLIPQFVDLDLFDPSRASPDVRQALGLGPDDLLMVYMGRFDSEKHVHTLTDMVRHLPVNPRAALVMAGDGPLRGDLEAAARAEPRIHVRPYETDKIALATLLASADVYVTAGPHEVAAFAVVEAQAAGLPVVGVAAGGLLDRVHDGLGELVPVDDANAMAAAVLRAFDDRAALGLRVRDFVEENYSWIQCFEQIIRIYENRFEATPSPN